jgi:hypothetical protein
VRCQSRLKIRDFLQPWFLVGLATDTTASWWVTSHSLSLRLSLVELSRHTLLMSLEDILGDTLHTEDFHIEA